MKSLYYSAAVRLENGITCVIGMQVLTAKEEEANIEAMECLYRFMIARYFGNAGATTFGQIATVMAFGQIDKESFELKTNLTIRADF